jgi:RNA polymerase sigma-70 factor (ECF subfamily)
LHAKKKMLPGQLSDETLVTRVALGDETAFETLYDRHAAIILGICLKIIGDRTVAEEILQETFWRVWQSATTYQSQRGPFRAWLFKIARNLAIDAYRRRKVRPQARTENMDLNDFLDQVADPGVDIQDQVQSNLMAQQVRRAIKILPHEQRQVIELAYFYGMTRQQIAKTTGEALGTIHTRARLGMQKLSEELKRSTESK